MTAGRDGFTLKSPREVPRSDGEIAGPAGTKVTVELKSTTPLQHASFVAGEGEIIELEKTADDHSRRGSFVIWSHDAKLTDEITGHFVHASARYRAKLVDINGYENDDPLWHSITRI